MQMLSADAAVKTIRYYLSDILLLIGSVYTYEKLRSKVNYM